MDQEFEILQSIYPELAVKGRTATLEIPTRLNDPVDAPFLSLPSLELTHLPPLRVDIALPSKYPRNEPPEIRIQCSWISAQVIADLEERCQSMWTGDEVIYDILDHLYTMSDTAFGICGSDGIEPFDDALYPTLASYQLYAKQVEFDLQSYECQICLDWQSGRDCIQLTCDHIFCKACLRDMLSLHIKEGSVNLIRCPCCPVKMKGDEHQASGEPQIPQTLPLSILQKLVSVEEVVRYSKLLRKQELECLPPQNWTHCPREFCATALSRDPDEKLVVCTQCEYAFCPDCLKGYHGIEPCKRILFSSHLGELYKDLLENDSKIKDRQSMERMYGKKNLERLVRDLEDDLLADKWRMENAQHCPSCNVFVEKSMGCNHMICGICHCHFCFLCGEQLSSRNPYSHYGDKGLSCYGKLFEGLTGLEDPFGGLEF